LHDERRRMLADPMNELYLVKEWFRTDNRVVFAEEKPESVFPAPFRIDMPITVELSSESLQSMYVEMDKPWIGAIRYFTPGHDNDEAVTIWNSAVVERARPYVTSERNLEDVVGQIAGFEWHASEAAQLADLRENDHLDEKVVRVDPEVARLREQLREARRPHIEESAARVVARSINARTGGNAARIARGVNNKLDGLPARVVRKL